MKAGDVALTVHILQFLSIYGTNNRATSMLYATLLSLTGCSFSLFWLQRKCCNQTKIKENQCKVSKCMYVLIVSCKYWKDNE